MVNKVFGGLAVDVDRVLCVSSNGDNSCVLLDVGDGQQCVIACDAVSATSLVCYFAQKTASDE